MAAAEVSGTVAGRARGRGRARLLRRLPIELASLAGGALVWEVIARSLNLLWLPPLTSILGEFAALLDQETIRANIVSSVQALAIGFSISLVAGLVIGALMGRFRSVEAALDVYVNALLVAPTIVLIPVFFAIFGLGDGTRLAVVVVYSLFVIVINTMTGIKNVDPSMVEMARSFNAGELFIIRKILIPASLPLVLAGVRLGLGRAVKGMITGEMFVTFVGLGALAQKYGAQFDMTKVFAVTMIVLVVAVASNWLAQTIENRLTRWAD